MFIETVPNRNSPPTVLLRESYRDDTGRSQKRTLANLIKLSAEVVAGLKALGFPPGSGGTRSEHYAASPVIPSMTIRASAGVL